MGHRGTESLTSPNSSFVHAQNVVGTKRGATIALSPDRKQEAEQHGIAHDDSEWISDRKSP